MMRYYFSFIFAFLFIAETQSQSTFSRVHNIFQTHCTVGCHSGPNPSVGLDLSGPLADVYGRLIEQDPVNPAALSNGMKLVDRGYVRRSYLFKKINAGLDAEFDLEQAEGGTMPRNAPALSETDRELIRQWILFGAPDTGEVVDMSLVNDYYAGNGFDATYQNHDAPAAGEGFQMYVGKVFIPAGEEREFFIKYDPLLEENIEIPRIVTMMPEESHHWVTYKFFPGQDQSYRDGLRWLDENSHGGAGDGIGSGPGLYDFQLPQGTAYFWPTGTVLDLNLHIVNTDQNNVLAADLYVNIYTQAVGTADQYMFVRNFINSDIAIPFDNQEHEFEVVAADSQETNNWMIWQLYSHTHRYGTDYDIWLRNEDGTKGDQIYEGFFNQDYTFNQGFYNWGVEVAVRYFDPLFEVNPHSGFIHRAKYINTAGPDTVRWGDSAFDEMMVMGFQYVFKDESVHIEEANEQFAEHRVYPNPVTDKARIEIITKRPLSNLSIELFDAVGRQQKVSYQTSTNVIELKRGNLAPGLYPYTLLNDGTPVGEGRLLVR